MTNHPNRNRNLFATVNAAAYDGSVSIPGARREVAAAEFIRMLQRHPQWARVRDYAPTGGLYRKIWADEAGNVVAITNEYRSPRCPTEYFVVASAA